MIAQIGKSRGTFIPYQRLNHQVNILIVCLFILFVCAVLCSQYRSVVLGLDSVTVGEYFGQKYTEGT